jgi:hypothetical protein
MPCRLDGAFKRLGARIGEKHRIRKSRVHQALAQPLLFRNGENIGRVPHFFGGAFERADNVRISMTQGIHRNAGMEIEIVSAMLVIQAHALAPLESEIGPGIGAVERRHGHFLWLRMVENRLVAMRDNSATKTKNALATQRVSLPELGRFCQISQ